MSVGMILKATAGLARCLFSSPSKTDWARRSPGPFPVVMQSQHVCNKEAQLTTLGQSMRHLARRGTWCHLPLLRLKLKLALGERTEPEGD